MKTINQFILLLSFITQITMVQASEFWVAQKENVRQFYSLDTSEGDIVLKKYSQEKGDFQERLEKKTFVRLSEAYAYLNVHARNFLKVEKLEHWPIIASQEGSVEKGLFGKKNTSIWSAKNQWSEEWELKFAEWIEQSVRPNFYQLYNIETDCADAVVGLRWIFARINSLPAANSINDSGDLFGNFSMPRKWRKIPKAKLWHEDELFMKALKYIMDVSYTRSIIDDGYPVRIDRIGLIAGDYIVTRFRGLGHAKVISETHFDELTEMPIYTLASTLPIKVRELVREAFVDPEWSKHIGKEILAFRWPIIKNGEWVLKASETHSRYSREQYDDKLKEKFPAFISFILSRVKETYDPIRLLELGTQEISKYIKQRMSIVTSGYSACGARKCSIDQIDYKNWSTTSRDEVIIKKFTELDRLVKEFEVISPGLYEIWVQKLKTSKMIIEGESVNLATIRFLFESGYTSADPNVLPKERWGLETSKSLALKLDEAQDLLAKRKKIIGQIPSPCRSEVCFPKNAEWLEGNTYLIDAELNKLYVAITTFCQLREVGNCESFLKSLGQKIYVYENEQKSLADWVSAIPLFHSDPRVSFKRRWGNLEGKLLGAVLPYFESIKISQGALALLDERKIFHLESGKIIYEAPEKAKLALTDDDKMYLISESRGEIHQITIANGTISLGDVLDPEHILLKNADLSISYLESESFGVFLLKNVAGNKVFRIRQGRIEVISHYDGAISLKENLLTAVQNSSTMTFVDLQKNKIFEFTLPLTGQFKNMNKMIVLSYSYPNVFLEYKDSDWGLHYPVRVNLEKKTWDEIDLQLSGPFDISWSSAKSGKAFVLNKTGEDYPELYALDFEKSEPVVTRLDNNFVDAFELNGVIYFIQSLGTQWSQDLENRLMVWSQNISEFTPRESLGNPKFMTEHGIYFSGEELGAMLSFDQVKKMTLPRSLLSPTHFTHVQVGEPTLFGYRFDSSYGEFLSMGGTIDLKSSFEEDILPNYSIYSWINKSDLLHERWGEHFKKSTVSSGQLISIGKNMGVWWAPSE